MTTGAEQGTQPSLTGFSGDTSVSPPRGYERRLAEDVAVLDAWLCDYISRPDPQLLRKGAVCPFVPAALQADALRAGFHYEVSGKDPDELRSLLEEELVRFMRRPAEDSLDSLVVVLPDLGEDGYAALDDAHARLKDTAVAGGAMIGQFHPACDERSVRNDGFRVSRSPLPLLAIRHMASHDILFLHELPHWFAAYRERFGAQFAEGRIREPLMLGLYATAERRHIRRKES
ncbi:DUF6875 domain-containing protein [Streptomyces alanosinicus]|uniref:DUF6875 domain-containing protein n=1 Tax=Streptomyces alanosinicus TaxID=68171 RepID=A0A918YMJ2_9ACTN|nr:hypothetical protein [Streptomyces alanosinicus]GHE08124.1 hypothetical protein GCM10010339_55430 [Streptomyces alanosinicus]